MIDVMFLFIGPIKPDWLADQSSSDKARPQLVYPLLAPTAVRVHPQDQRAALLESRAQMFKVWDSHSKTYLGVLVPSITPCRFKLLQSDSVVLTLKEMPQMSISTWSLKGMLLKSLSRRQAFLSLRIIDILDLVNICCGGLSCVL